MVFEINKVIINRYHCYNNSSLHAHIESTEVEHVGKIKSKFVPQINEILVINNKKYLVEHVIRKIPDNQELFEEEFIVDVVDFPETRVASSGSNSWPEQICLSIDSPINK